MPRFYVPSALNQLYTFSLPEATARHVQVLRSQPGDMIELFDGLGMVYLAEIMAMGKKNVDVLIRQRLETSVESPLSITLWQSVSSSDRMDLTIQKSVELGVTAIQPVLTERSSQRLNAERAEKKQARWQEIAVAACEQSGRTVVPKIYPVRPFDAALLAQSPADLKLLMSLNRTQALNQLPPPESVCLLIGPEGGLSNDEEDLAIQYGFQAISLGKRVLRTETASLAALAAMQMLWGDFKIA
ncbi:16S rRNA (uracil(1498)-N(3))-methyltransferase [Neisseriaceae bacterium ESL0693]|nr:16S rRNA (uracil(1498)-N(3))-methyltransferase [Neisseriaceae bacterium ESL0693]